MRHVLAARHRTHRSRPSKANERLHRVVVVLALAVCLLGCDAFPPGDKVELHTTNDTPVGCFLMGASGELIVDAKHGTALEGANGSIRPVVWPPGFTGRYVGSEVEVLDTDGKLVATTGRAYEIMYSNTPVGGNPDELYACGQAFFRP